LRIDTASQIVLGVIFIAGSLSYRPIKEWFDRLTNKLFYQDAYDSQEVIGKLNTTIVSTINIESLLSQVSDTLVGSLKSQFCVFGLKETEHAPRRTIGDRHLALTEEELKIVRSATVHQHRRVILVEDTNEAAPELYRILKKYDIEALVRLVSAAGEGIEGVGYIALGAKKSGNPYSSQDVKLLEIVSSELAIAIQNVMQFEEIQQFNVILEERIEQATRKLQRTNEKLKALDETKDEFISMASHQLRTPLTSVKGYLSMVIEGDAGQITETQRKLLWQAFISSQRMVNLIADLLNVSRLRTGKFIIESTPTNLANIIAEEIDQLRETAQARELKLIFDKPKDFPVLMLDETKIRQVAMNFMDNAIYYTPPGGEIHVELKDTPKSIEFAVADNGIGVPKHEQPHLFTKFYRAGNARKARPDGTGLGLFMAKKVVMAQGGSILFHSKEGKGSTFGFVLAKERLLPSAKAAGTQEITLNPEVTQP
jgi:signal transduction histidine kinase